MEQLQRCEILTRRKGGGKSTKICLCVPKLKAGLEITRVILSVCYFLQDVSALQQFSIATFSNVEDRKCAS
jgi:hypothetical protein